MKMDHLTKICKTCNIEKELASFRKRHDGLFGVAAHCKQCIKICDKKYRSENTDRVKEQKRSHKKRMIALVKIPDRKICGSCHEEKPMDGFSLAPGKRDGLSSQCRACKSIYDRSFRVAHKEKLREQNKVRYSNTKNVESEKHKDYYRKNRDVILAKVKNRANSFGAHERRATYLRSYGKKKRREDPMTKIIGSHRNKIHYALKNHNARKSATSRELLGCSPEIARWFLEQQFYPDPNTGIEMTWNNHGMNGWHIDHIIPVSSFDMSDPIQQRMAFHVSNLQPLWWHENLSKGRKVDFSKHADGRYPLEHLMAADAARGGP